MRYVEFRLGQKFAGGFEFVRQVFFDHEIQPVFGKGLLPVLIIIRHRANITRLLISKEHQISKSKIKDQNEK